VNLTEPIYRALALVHPNTYKAFNDLYEVLLTGHKKGETYTLFAPFETYRTPLRQAELFNQKEKVTNARAWESAHNYGLAVDFVPKLNGQWSWSEDHDYAYLREKAEEHGLFVPIRWDPCHVVHPIWYSINMHLI
jgi:hypothetical protein